jgi:hypothetical protein
MSHYTPLSRERIFTLCDDQVMVNTSLEDVFGSLMQDNPTREECREMVFEILRQYVDVDEMKALISVIEGFV